MDVVFLITARGGSKGIPRKNLREVGGLPLIAWTIRAALGSANAQRVIVSTDDPEIAAVAAQFGAEVPFIRPIELSLDTSPHVDVVEHAISWLMKVEGKSAEYVLLLQPTSPLRNGSDIDGILDFTERKDADAVVSVTAMHPHPHFAMRIGDDSRLLDIADRRKYVRRQDLDPRYATNGAMYLIRTAVLLDQKTFLPTGVYGYVMPPERSLDVDTLWDLDVADFVLRSRHGNSIGLI